MSAGTDTGSDKINSVQALLAQGQYADAADLIELDLNKTEGFEASFTAFAGALLMGNASSRLVDYIKNAEIKLLQGQETAGLAAAVLRINGQDTEADKFESAFLQRGGGRDALYRNTAHAARMSGRPDLHLDYLLKRVDIPGGDRNRLLHQYTQVCLQYIELERAEAARDLVDDSDPMGQFVLANLEAAKGDKGAVLARVDSWLSDPNSISFYASAIESLWSMAGIPELTERMRAAMFNWQKDPNIIGRALYYHFIGLDGTDASGRRHFERLDVTPENYLSLVEAQIDHGVYAQALQLLEQTARFARPETVNRRNEFGALATKLSSLSVSRRTIKDVPESDWILSEPAEPGKLCVLFTGLNGRPTLGLETMDRYLASLGYQVLIVRDFNRLCFANGIVSRGPSQTEALEALANRIEVSGAKDPVFLGTSLGAIGAVDLGLKLGVRRILAFGYLDRARDMDRWRVSDSRAALVAAREHIFTNHHVPSFGDHMTAAGPDARADIFYNPANGADAYYARTFADVPGARMHPIEASFSHDTLRTAVLSGELERFL